MNIGLVLFAVFTLVASTISGFATYFVRISLFAEQLRNTDILLLTVVFAIIVSLLFVLIVPVHLNGERKKEEDW